MSDASLRQKVHIIRLVAPIGDHRPSISIDDVRRAIAPDEPFDEGLLVDLHALHLRDGECEFWQRAQSTIKEKVNGFIEHRVIPSHGNALAVFAFAPIPLLCALGRLLGDKLPTRIFERHRHTDSWRWDERGVPLQWQTRLDWAEQDVQDVAVLLSISGMVHETAVHKALNKPFHLCELRIPEPRPNVVRTHQDLTEFIGVWRSLLSSISARIGPHAHIHLFPAAPLSVSIECGRRLLPKADPRITVYDYFNGDFISALDIGAPAARVDVGALNAPANHGRVKLLILAANPSTHPRLDPLEEIRAIKEKVRQAKYTEFFDIDSAEAVRPDDLHQVLLDNQPTIVHFSGHGDASSGLVLHGDTSGTESLVSVDALKHLFKTLKGNIRIVVLNTCASAECADAISEDIDFVVGMNAPVGDDSARKFAASLYLGIASGESVNKAFELGISAIKVNALPDDRVPILKVRPGASSEDVLCSERTSETDKRRR